MRYLPATLAVAAFLTLAGCSSRERVVRLAPAGRPSTQADQPSTGTGPSTKSSPSGGNDPAANVKPPMPADIEASKKLMKRWMQQGAFKVAPPAAEGWRTSNVTPQELMMRADASIAKMAGVNGESMFLMDSAEGTGRATGYIKIAGPTRFAVEYSLPATGAAVNKVVADGSRRAIYEAGRWTRPESISIRGKTSTSLSEFAKRFPREVFGNLTERTPAWTRLYGLLSKAQGMRTVVEEKTVTRGSMVSRLIRLRSEASKPKQFVLEARFDATHTLPLTIRVLTVDNAGKPFLMQWQAGYNFSQKVDQSEFFIPAAAN